MRLTVQNPKGICEKKSRKSPPISAPSYFLKKTSRTIVIITKFGINPFGKKCGKKLVCNKVNRAKTTITKRENLIGRIRSTQIIIQLV